LLLMNEKTTYHTGIFKHFYTSPGRQAAGDQTIHRRGVDYARR
jgi:hypothetical protein